MFDFGVGYSELFVLALVAVIVIGPKDLPRVLRTFGQFMTKARGMAREFQGHVDAAMKDAGVADLKKDLTEARGAISSVVGAAPAVARAPVPASAFASTNVLTQMSVADSKSFADYFGAEPKPGETRVAGAVVTTDQPA
jgi:sec-independent protein translocase protein TatB